MSGLWILGCVEELAGDDYESTMIHRACQYCLDDDLSCVSTANFVVIWWFRTATQLGGCSMFHAVLVRCREGKPPRHQRHMQYY